jgi:hypothetical protein
MYQKPRIQMLMNILIFANPRQLTPTRINETIVHVLNDITPPQTKRILGRRSRMVVGFITTYAINAYHH